MRTGSIWQRFRKPSRGNFVITERQVSSKVLKLPPSRVLGRVASKARTTHDAHPTRRLPYPAGDPIPLRKGALVSELLKTAPGASGNAHRDDRRNQPERTRIWNQPERMRR
jgi:hypothetical protein